MTYASQINVPVLLIHGSADTTAPVDQSEKLYAKLKALHKDVKLIIVPDAVHIFNFRQQQQGTFAWKKTILWLKQHLKTENNKSQANRFSRPGKESSLSPFLTDLR